jgi:uncharacterized membrane protein YecN with MAPEG domain
MHITFLYAAVLALLFVALSFRTLRMRRRLRIAVGDRGNDAMLRAMRVHANFAEYVPLCLLLFYFAEEAGARPVLVHAYGISLVAGRVLHAWGVSHLSENYRFRVAGMTLTFLPLIAASLRLLSASLESLWGL